MQAAVLGTGLIGSSVGIALRHAGWSVAGWDPDPEALEGARKIGAVDEAVVSDREAVTGAGLVVAAGPVDAIAGGLRAMQTDALVTDVASVKLPVVAAAAHLPHFVGGHPMAGRETAGPSGASGSLFRGAPWILTTDGADPADLERMRAVVESLGAVPVVMAAAEHDQAVALSSHLPHVVAAALVLELAGEPEALRLAGGGFRDLTRIAQSDPGWWTDVLAANAAAVAPALRALAGDLTAWAERVERDDRETIGAELGRAREARRGMAAPTAVLGVVLEDRPGEIARVGHALSESEVDLRDLQLRHATHGGGGVLTLSVRPEELDGLRAALSSEGFRLMG